jgi:thioredoxin-related protein
MRKVFFVIALSMMFCGLQAQEKEKVKLYNPDLDGMVQIDEALEAASTSGKHVFVQVGGNWCPWCILFDKYVKEDQELKDFVDKNYVVVHLNMSPENKNEESLARLGYPQRFGYPVFVVLDAKGKRVHTQNSGILEEGKGYNRKHVMGFFRNWTVVAVDPATYKK